MLVEDTLCRVTRMDVGGGIHQIIVHPMIYFDLMRWYKGIEDPQEHICFYEQL